ncbi:MAG: DnaD domain protein [Christensenellales bacterium]|jgi:DnaD/phage-associated family protein
MQITFGSNRQTDYTPVHNAFISDLMPAAPGDYVKAYLYLLLLFSRGGGIDLSSAAKGLRMAENSLLEAIEYWEKRSLLYVEKGDTLHIHFSNIQDVQRSPVYAHSDFNAHLLALFSPRELSNSDFERIYDWIEVYGLQKEAVLELVQYCLKEKGPRTSVAYMHKVAKSWADEGITTAEAAQEFAQRHSQTTKDTRMVLKHLGILRLPTQDEIELMRKWRTDWGFSLDSIFFACKELTRIQQPNMAYLDKVLHTLYEQGRTKSQDVLSHFSNKDDRHSQLTQIAYELGSRSRVTPALLERQEQWLSLGFSQKALLTIAHLCAQDDRHSFKYFEEQLGLYAKLGLFEPEKIEAHHQKLQLLHDDVRAVFERMGSHERISGAHRSDYESWIKAGLPFEVILLAAEYAKLSRNKYAALTAILRNWIENGITTLQAAKKEHAQHQSRSKTAPQKAANPKYSDELLDALAEQSYKGENGS